MPEKNLDQIVFWENVRQALVPGLVLVAFGATLLVFSLNVPVATEQVFGTVLNTVGPVNYEGPVGVTVLVELDSGRVVATAISPKILLPKIGQRVTLLRYTKRFFGDSFGLKQ